MLIHGNELSHIHVCHILNSLSSGAHIVIRVVVIGSWWCRYIIQVNCIIFHYNTCIGVISIISIRISVYLRALIRLLMLLKLLKSLHSVVHKMQFLSLLLIILLFSTSQSICHPCAYHKWCVPHAFVFLFINLWLFLAWCNKGTLIIWISFKEWKIIRVDILDATQRLCSLGISFLNVLEILLSKWV